MRSLRAWRFDEDGAPAAERARIVLLAADGVASRAIGRRWMYNRHGVEVAGALRREAACGCRRNGRAGR